MHSISKPFRNRKLFDLDLKRGHKIYKPDLHENNVDEYSIYKISATKSYLIYFIRSKNGDTDAFCPFDGDDYLFLYHTLESAKRAMNFTRIERDKAFLYDSNDPYVHEYIETYPERVI